jgi:hypothetical protein
VSEPDPVGLRLLHEAARDADGFEARLNEALEIRLLSAERHDQYRFCRVVEVIFEGRYPDTQLWYRFEDDRLPGCHWAGARVRYGLHTTSRTGGGPIR